MDITVEAQRYKLNACNWNASYPASSDAIPLVRSQSAHKRMTNHVRGAPPESRLRHFSNVYYALL